VNTPPTAVISGPTTGIEGEVLTYDGTGSSDPDGTIASYEWDMGDGTILSGDIVTHSYSTAATYTVTLTVTDDDGDSDSATQSVTIDPAGPVYEKIWRIYDIGSSYLKSTDYADIGRMTTTLGVNSWWPVRTLGYGETTLRTSWPFTMASGSSSPITAPQDALDWPWYLWTFYGFEVTGTYMFDVNTGAGVDPWFIPILDEDMYYAPEPPSVRIGWAGGNASFDWYGNYLTATDIADITSSTSGHYVFSYYGATRSNIPPTLADDGWWYELHGTMTYDREAAIKYLGFARDSGDFGYVSDDLDVQFLAYEDGTATGFAGEIQYAWMNDWAIEGGTNGIFDIYTAYEFSQDLRFLVLKLDPTSTADSLVIRFWTVSWGMDIQTWRYIEATGLSPNWQGYAEQVQIAGDITPTHANITLDTRLTYVMLAWKDEVTDTAAWQIAPEHTDYGGNNPAHTVYISPYNPYDPEQVDPDPVMVTWTPGIVAHGAYVFYAACPMENDIFMGETIIYELPTEFIFYTPYAGTDDGYSAATGLDPWKIAELDAASFMAPVTLGTCWPDMSGWYDSGTNTVTIVGPQDFPRKPNHFDPALMENGVPELVMVPA